jgi:hypothetical protein
MHVDQDLYHLLKTKVNYDWLVVSTPLKNISQLGLLYHSQYIGEQMFQTINQII